MEGQSGFLVHLSCQVKGLWVMPVGLCVAVSPCPGGQRAGAASRVGFLTSSPPQLNQIPHRSCDALMVFVQVSVYEVLKRQKHLSNLILANSCKPSVEQQQQKNPCKNQGKCLRISTHFTEAVWSRRQQGGLDVLALA